MSVRGFRLLTGVVFLASVPGLIVSSVADRTGAAVTFGLIAVAAALVLLAVTEVAVGRISPWSVSVDAGGDSSEREAAALEHDVRALVAAGADEAAVRGLVRRAVRLGRGSDARARRQRGTPSGN
ncbi:MAG: hypothetical protein HYX34_04845 [Actinobacteria bacterium]|nr:hypothetical protein [Actinomycetota bacterium]